MPEFGGGAANPDSTATPEPAATEPATSEPAPEAPATEAAPEPPTT